MGKLSLIKNNRKNSEEKNTYLKIKQQIKLVNVAMNAVLVEYGARPGFLLQPIDYGEKWNPAKLSSKTVNIINSILDYTNLTWFVVYSGILFTRKTRKCINFNISDRSLGKILGYPCASDDFTTSPFFVRIRMKISNEYIELLTNVCNSKDISHEKLHKDIEKIVKRVNRNYSVDIEIGRRRGRKLTN